MPDKGGGGGAGGSLGRGGTASPSATSIPAEGAAGAAGANRSFGGDGLSMEFDQAAGEYVVKSASSGRPMRTKDFKAAEYEMARIWVHGTVAKAAMTGALRDQMPNPTDMVEAGGISLKTPFKGVEGGFRTFAHVTRLHSDRSDTYAFDVEYTRGQAPNMTLAGRRADGGGLTDTPSPYASNAQLNLVY